MIFSLGATKTKLDNLDIGSVISNDVSISYNLIPLYTSGTISTTLPARPKNYIKSRANGTLNVVTDELTISSFLDKMLGIASKLQVDSCSFDATCISGEIYPIPQFSITVPENGFPTITVSPVLKSATLDMTSVTSTNNKTCNLNFVTTTTTAAVTADDKKILTAVTINGKLISSLSITSKCDYELIYDDTDNTNLFPIDCVLRSAYIEGEASITDFTTISGNKIDLEILTTGTTSYSHSFEDATIIPCGFKSSNGINSWQLKFSAKIGSGT